jgi:hypothetical protein
MLAAALAAIGGKALAEPMSDMCSAPKMHTEKWHQLSEIAGVSLLIPSGYVARGGTASAQYYYSGEHRLIAVGNGPGPSMLSEPGGIMTQMSTCETVIAGRRVSITVFDWVQEDAGMSPSGAAGQRYLVVARFFVTGAHPEAFVAYRTNIQSDVGPFRQLFWTASFDAPAGQPIEAAQPLAPPTVAASLESAAPTAVAAAPACVAGPQPPLPAPSAVVDSAVVQMLVAGSAPLPHCFEVVALRFDPAGSLAGMTVSQSDLPDAEQRRLATLIASNLKSHDAHGPASFQLRIDAGDAALHYSVLAAAACAP